MIKDWSGTWMPNWVSEDYKKLKQQDIDFVLKYFKDSPPRNVLDIGCGLAWETRALQKEFGTELWLLDGDKDSNPEGKPVGWRGNAKNMSFYHKLDQLDSALKETGLTEYKLIDCNNIKIPNTIKFDLIYSGISCGFHYEANTYRELIEKHSHKKTKVILDLRTKVLYQKNVEIVEVLVHGRKHKKCLVKFKD